MGFIKIFLSLLINATTSLLLLYCIMSWFVSPDFPLRQWIDGIINQLLDPIRRFMPSFGMFDLSPIILMLILQLMQRFVNRL
jgi:YggT family protein